MSANACLRQSSRKQALLSVEWFSSMQRHRNMFHWAFSALILSAALAFSQASNAHSQFCFIGARDLADPSAPRFEDYSAQTSASRRTVKLDLNTNPIAREFRTVIRDEMSKGANFAGRYRVAIWGCGSSCAQFAVVNLETGRVITAKNVHTVSGVHLGADDFLPDTESGAWGFRFKRNSRLLVLVGTINEDESKEGAFYYVLKSDHLVLTHKTTAGRNTCQDEQN
jgi:hypothetical protein